MDMKELSTFDLCIIRDQAVSEIEHRASVQLEEAALAYIDALGNKDGMERMGLTLLEKVSQKHYPDGWAGFIQYLVKVSG